jgi:hypothetical protein
MQLLDGKRGSNSDLSHPRPSDMNRFRSAPGQVRLRNIARAPTLYLGTSCDPV